MPSVIEIAGPTPEQEAYLNAIGASQGGGDWAAAAARRHLHYLFKCKDEAEKIEYLASAIRLAEVTGAVRAGREIMELIASKSPRG